MSYIHNSDILLVFCKGLDMVFLDMVLLAIEEGCCTVRISPPGMVNRKRMITFLNMPACQCR